MTWHIRRTATRDDQVPSWPDGPSGTARRVLVEHPEPAARDTIVRGLRDRGYEVVSCGGPGAHGDSRTERCPVLHGERCPGVDGADVIVSSLNINDQRERAIVRTIAEDPTSPAMYLEASNWQFEQALGPESEVSHHFPFSSVDQIVTAIEDLPTARPLAGRQGLETL